MGINIPLSFVCWKCQNDVLREQALEILESWPHHEGSTGAKVCLLFMKQLRELELAAIRSSSSYTRVAEASMNLVEDQTKGVLQYQHVTPDQQVVIETKVISYEWNVSDVSFHGNMFINTQNVTVANIGCYSLIVMACPA